MLRDVSGSVQGSEEAVEQGTLVTMEKGTPAAIVANPILENGQLFVNVRDFVFRFLWRFSDWIQIAALARFGAVC